VKVALKVSAPEGPRTVNVSLTADRTTHTAPGPSFTVARPTLTFGARETVVVDIRNETETAVTSLPVTYHVIVAAAPDGSGVVHQAATAGRVSLKPGATRLQPVSFTLPAAFPAGDHVLIVRLQPGLDGTGTRTLLAMPVRIA
jgi:hypothetical protein